MGLKHNEFTNYCSNDFKSSFFEADINQTSTWCYHIILGSYNFILSTLKPFILNGVQNRVGIHIIEIRNCEK